jgi:chaperonin GroES
LLELKGTYNLEKIMAATNAAEMIKKEDLAEIGEAVVEDFLTDDKTRDGWKAQYIGATKLALQIAERKTTPWEGASNVKFPLLTVAALQFHSRAYPALVEYPELVKCRVIGDDPDGSKTDHADRVSTFMSYQLLEQDENWEEDTDRMYLILPIVGTVVRKSYYESVRGVNCSELILPEDFVVSYYTKNLKQCPRCTHVLHMNDREIKNKQLQGIYVEVDIEEDVDHPEDSPSDQIRKERGYTPPDRTDDDESDRDVLEQHRYIDMDDDGYAEPYIITVDRNSRKVLRLIARFSETDIIYDTSNEVEQLKSNAQQIMSQPLPQGIDQAQAQQEMQQRQQALEAIKDQITSLENDRRIIDIKPMEYFTKYSFIPAIDGSFYDMGFGALLGPVNSSINTAINQLFDAGTMSNANIGFIGSNAHIRGNDYRFRPFEWKRADMVGADLKSALVPLPINPPSTVTFQLLELLINYGERVSSVTDLMVGETPGQNTPATTSQNALNEGQKVFQGILKRLYRAQKHEFQKLYLLNRIYLNPSQYFTVLGTNETSQIYQQDFAGNPNEVVPSADPNVGSDAQRLQQAQFLAARSAQVPGYNPQGVEMHLLKAMKVPDAANLYAPDKFPPQPNPDMLELQLKGAEHDRKVMETKGNLYSNALTTLATIQQTKANTIFLIEQAKAISSELDVSKMEHQLNMFDSMSAHLQAMIEANQSQQEIENARESAEADRALAAKQQSAASSGT